MNKAFLFDMDGVIVDSERTWSLYDTEFHESLFGKDIANMLNSDEAVGLSLPGMYDIAKEHGLSLSKEQFYAKYDEQAEIVYEQATITDGLENIISYLQSMNIKIGLVSASPETWIKRTLAKAHIENAFDYILSLHEREDLRHKPAPDGFREAMRELHAAPRTTIILEDSNRGIQSAKASGAFTIGFRQHLVASYQQHGADTYADTISDVLKIVEKQIQKM